MSKVSTRTLCQNDIKDVEGIYDQYWTGSFRQKLSRKIGEFISRSEKSLEEKVGYIVAVENENILGAISFRKCPDLMLKYSKTSNPVEIYILAVKTQGKGVGKILLFKALDEARLQGYTEVLLYNSDFHNESRGFYLHSGFEDIGAAIAPDGELGHVFRKDLK